MKHDLNRAASRLSRRAALLACGTAVALAAWLPAARAQTIELKFGHVGAPGSLFQLSADEFARRANEKLGAKAKVVVFGSSQLGGDKELLQKLKLGTVDFALPSTVMSSETDLFGVFEMPYLVKDRKHMAAIEKAVVWPKLAPAAEAKGLKLLAVWENGYRHLTNNKRPISTPADLAGIKLRTPNGKWRVRMFQEYGANPSPMKFSELFTALQTGVMDGQENPLTQIYSAKLHEVQKFLSMSGHVYTPAYVMTGAQEVGEPARRRAQGARGRRPRDAGLCLRDRRETGSRAARQAQGQRDPGQRGRQARLRRRQQEHLRGLRQGGRGREGADRHRGRPGQVTSATVRG